VPVTNSSEPVPDAAPAPALRKRPPRWIILGLLGLFVCWFAAMQWRQRAGAPVQWEHDLAQAEQKARDSKTFVLLMLQAPQCPIAAALDRDLFSLRDVREEMAHLVCCRLEVRPGDAVSQRYGFKHDPLVLTIRPGTERPLMPAREGKIQYPELDTLLRETLKLRDKGR
jgi:hypothetical protein